MHTSSSTRLFAMILALCFAGLLVSGVAGRGESSLWSVFKEAQADMNQQLVALSRAGLPQ
jgi:hypothetical protein